MNDDMHAPPEAPPKMEALITSDTIGKLAAPLAKLQGELGHAKKDSVNPHFRSSYASLTAVIDAAREPLAKNGFSVIQAPTTDLTPRMVSVTTRLLHASGEWLQTSLSCAPKDVSPQGIGTAVSYLRRYALQALLCQGSDDDDGASSSGNGGQNQGRMVSRTPPQKKSGRQKKTPAKAPAKPTKAEAEPAPEERGDAWEPPESETITREQQVKLFAVANEFADAGRGPDDVRRHIEKVLGISSTGAMLQRDFDSVLDWIETGK